ncbi:uncharacterized protein [Procambarus clarkii]|uniref:uncharacterized protein n=1 Tax=Procambarus clarkii TaxID=6728 RepID=UPI003742E28E
MKGCKFDIQEYLMQLQVARCQGKTKRQTPTFSKTRHCVFSQDPVHDDLIWRSVVRGEVTAALRRTNNYAATHTLYQRCQSSGSSLASQSSGPAGGADSFMQRLQRSYAHAAHGPSLPPTSNGRIGWRSSLPDLRLERYGACSSVKPLSPGHDQRHALSPRPSSAARPSLQ